MDRHGYLPDTSHLAGYVVDQEVLIGIINALYNTGHAVLAIDQLDAD
jgi:hypothetical protein